MVVYLTKAASALRMENEGDTVETDRADRATKLTGTYNVSMEVLCLDLDRIIASSCRQKILLALSKTRSMNVTGLVRTINSTYNLVNPNLVMLEKEGIIEIAHVGRMKIINLNTHSKKTLALMKALSILNSFTGGDQSNLDKLSDEVEV